MHRRTLLAAGGAALGAPGARAQAAYPARSVRLIIPWPPGQATDLLARVVAQRITENWGTPIVPENRAGAGGMIGTDAAAKAAPDGYTILAGSTGPMTTAPLVQRTPYDPDRDFIPVAMIGLSPYMLVMRPDFPAANAADFVALLRANPGKYTYATSGTGAAAHLITLMFLTPLQLDTVHVPFAGSGPALTAVLGGQVDFAIDTLAATGPLVRQGGFKTLGISLASGSALAPGVPPLATAAGLPGYDASAWGGYLLPAGTPQPIVDRLAAETAKATAAPEVRERLATLGIEPRPLAAEAFAAHLRTQREAFRAVIEANRIRLD